MVKFIKVDPSEVDNIRRGRRGRVSYPILKGFLETGHFIAKLDTTGMQQSQQSLYSAVGAYIRNPKMPIKIFSRAGDLHMMRLDIDPDGKKVEDWQTKDLMEQVGNAEPINPTEVDKRFKEEKEKTTK